jgi:hypothetical protein
MTPRLVGSLPRLALLSLIVAACGGSSTVPTFKVGGTVTGLHGDPLILSSGGQTVAVTADGSFTFAAPVDAGQSYGVSVSRQPTNLTCSVSNGSGTVTADVTSVQVTCSPDAFAVGGSVTGLASGQFVVVQVNGGETVNVSADGAFTFPAPIASGAAYAVTATAAFPVSCTVANGSGTMGSAAVSNVAVTCNVASFTVGGTVTGLVGGDSIALQMAGADTVTLGADGSFAFTTPVAYVGRYDVSIATAPTGETCTVDGGSGIVIDNVTDINVTCTPNKYTLGGSVFGISSGQSIVLKNGSDSLTITANSRFTFPTSIPFGGSYAVSAVATYPMQCTVSSSGAGTMGAANVTNATVTCSTKTYDLSGTVTGLPGGPSLSLFLNGHQGASTGVNGPIDFGQVPDLTTYVVTIQSQPLGTVCTVTNGSGTISGADVSSISVSCVPATFAVGGTVNGLVGNQTVTITDNGTDSITVGNGAFTFPTLLQYRANYFAAATGSYPASCSVVNGSGQVFGAVSNIIVNCAPITFVVGGNVSGLIGGAAVVLEDNGGDDLAVSQNGGFTFATPVMDTAAYAVTVKNNPAGETCTVSSGSGALAGADVSTAAVSCTALPFHLGGTVSGLAAGDAVIIKNGNDAITVNANGSFALPTEVNYGDGFHVSAHGTGHAICSVSGGIATMPAKDVWEVSVACSDNSVTVGGTASGLNAGQSFTMLDNGDTDFPVTITANGPFVFPSPIAQGGSYAATIVAQPTLQRCSVANGSGSSSADVTNVAVSCVDTYVLSVTVSGLNGAVKLANGSDTVSLSQNGTASFATRLAAGDAYNITVSKQPLGQTCSATNGSATMPAQDNTVNVSCTPNVVVFRVDALAGTTLPTKGVSGFLDEYGFNGTAMQYVRTMPVPAWTDSASTPHFFSFQGSDPNEGTLSLSADGRMLVFGGYDVAVGGPTTGTVTNSVPSTIHRLVGTMDASSNFSVPVQITDAFAQFRSATTFDGTGFWMTGSAYQTVTGGVVNSVGGVKYAAPSANPQTTIDVWDPNPPAGNITPTGFAVQVALGRLYFSPNSVQTGLTGNGIFAFPDALPTGAFESDGVTPETPAVVINDGAAPLGFAILQVNPASTGPDTIYVPLPSPGCFSGCSANANKLKLEKWQLVSGTWTKVANFTPISTDATIAPANWLTLSTLTAVNTPAGVQLFAIDNVGSNGGIGNRMYTFLDDGVNLTPPAIPVLRSGGIAATGSTASAFRGISIAPHQ